MWVTILTIVINECEKDKECENDKERENDKSLYVGRLRQAPTCGRAANLEDIYRNGDVNKDDDYATDDDDDGDDDYDKPGHELLNPWQVFQTARHQEPKSFEIDNLEHWKYNFHWHWHCQDFGNIWSPIWPTPP